MNEFSQFASRLAGQMAWLLAWRPDDFWRATPVELLAILEARGASGAGDAPPDGATLTRLKEMFPDG